MKHALSNIALTEYDHGDELRALPELGIEGLEVSPSRVWHDWWHGLTAAHVADYRREAERAGLRIIGLHTLFWNQPELGLFRDEATRTKTLDYLAHLSAVCRDLGGHTLVFGSGKSRLRGALSLDDAIAETAAFFGELGQRIEGHGTCFAFEALGQRDTDFVNSMAEALRVVDAVSGSVLESHFDAKALVEAGEVTSECFERAKTTAVHFHANEPDLGVLGTSGEVDHRKLGELLRKIGYDGYVSIEQRQLNMESPLDDVARSADVLRSCYSD